MAKKKYKDNDTSTLGSPIQRAKRGKVQILVPAGDEHFHLLPALRYGKVSAEVFCRNNKRRAELGLPLIFAEE